MLQKLKTYLADESLFEPSDRLLLAVSGGADSMAMLHLFMQLPYSFVVLHCNFHLRAEESDKEEQFLRAYCQAHGVELKVQHFNTKEFAQKEGISIEMAARELRYAWFRAERESTKSRYILTAHHQDDLVETMLINLSRGTGIKGLTGISSKQGELVRPMLFASRESILAYAQECELPFCHDSSNDQLIYHRNVIRHQIIPLFEGLNSAFRQNVVRTAAHLQSTSEIYFAEVDRLQSEIMTDNRLDITRLKECANSSTVLYELLSGYGFNAAQCTDIYQSLDGNSGRKFRSKSHRLIKDRSSLILADLNDVPKFLPQLMVHEEPISPNFAFSTKLNSVEIDADKVCLPLKLRKWQEGDSFQPLGMKGTKKLSDFFTDQKLSILEKEAQWLVCSGDDIVWIVGRRIDDRFKITKQTKRVCYLSLSVR
ncbi:MAG: tRNA lysidine(34) synthetase TilS [Mangrovibacterium sp.]